MLSTTQREIIDAALRAADAGPLRGALRVGGGSIAAAFRIDTGRARFFLKLGGASHPFDAEAGALAEIAATHTVRVPEPISHGIARAHGFLLLEWIDLEDNGDWRAAGEQLARLHAVEHARFGWARDNTIGASPQSNTPCATWAEFWRERRLRPQFRFARQQGLALAALEERTCRASDALLADQAPPASLLHGDLWRGNMAFDTAGAPVVFDPSTYHGDAETDLAMTRLFGGFDAGFYAAYEARRPPRAGHRERSALYQLYHVLNHANLFGAGYIAQARALIERLATG